MYQKISFYILIYIFNLATWFTLAVGIITFIFANTSISLKFDNGFKYNFCIKVKTTIIVTILTYRPSIQTIQRFFIQKYSDYLQCTGIDLNKVPFYRGDSHRTPSGQPVLPTEIDN
jgi:hypothetical protein